MIKLSHTQIPFEHIVYCLEREDKNDYVVLAVVTASKTSNKVDVSEADIWRQFINLG